MSGPTLLVQCLSLLGAALCLVPYVCLQFHYLDAKKFTYNLLNALGSGILFAIALNPLQVGFFVMECIWFLASAIGCFKALQEKI